MKNKVQQTMLALSMLTFGLSYAQESRDLSVDQVMDLALQNHQQLKVSAKNIDIAKQQTEVAKLQKLPSITASTSQFFLGNALIIDKDFSNSTKVEMPHYGSTYSVQAQQLIFKGGLVNKSIEMYDLREQLAELDVEKDQQNVKFLVTSNYLDIYKLINQTEVYQNNKKLAQERLKNIQKFYQQGMITRNEVIRAELAIKNLDQGLLVLENNRKIVTYQLNVALGLNPDTQINPTESIDIQEKGFYRDYYENLAFENHPAMKSAYKNVEVADKNIEIINTDKMPTIAAFGGYNMQRPITTRVPAMDMYTNSWQSGISLSYNIDNLYKIKEKVKLGQLQKEQANEATSLIKEQLKVVVNAAYVKYVESIQQAHLFNDSKKLAEENYKITEAKYLNQLAVQAEMIDAQNQKLQAELDFANAEINVLYQYYSLLKTTGTL
ncbi:TolC family protein [Chryseobacterium sp. TY3]